MVGEVAVGADVVAAAGVVGLAGCSGLAVTVTGGCVVGFDICAWLCGAEGASLDAGLGVEVGTAAGVAAGVLGLAGMAVTVAGMGVAAGTGLVGEEAAWACTGLAWFPVSKL